MAKPSPSLQKKLDFYGAAGTRSLDVALSGTAKKEALRFLKTKSLDKIKGVTLAMKEDIRRSLILSQSTNQSLLAATSSLLGASKLERGAFRTSRARAASIARDELRAARQEGLVKQSEEEGVIFFTWICIFAPGSGHEDRRRHGQTHKMSIWRSLGLPPIHPRCACTLIPGRGVPIPRGIPRTKVRQLGIKARIFRQAKESDYLKMRARFIRCTDEAFGL